MSVLGFSPLPSIIIGKIMKFQPLSSIIIGNSGPMAHVGQHCEFHKGWPNLCEFHKGWPNLCEFHKGWVNLCEISQRLCELSAPVDHGPGPRIIYDYALEGLYFCKFTYDYVREVRTFIKTIYIYIYI